MQPKGKQGGRRPFLQKLMILGGAAAVPVSAQARQAAREEGSAFLPNYVRAQNYRSLKQSSFDKTGGNSDRWPIAGGQTLEVFQAKGAGMISHIWFTISAQSGNHLKELVLRIYWDGNANPSVESPVGDFFGLNLGEYVIYESEYLACSPGRSLNCYFAMPYRTGARITVTNEGKQNVGSFYSNIDYMELPALPEDALYFHASYRQAAPNKPVVGADGRDVLNPDGKNNHVYCETRGRGHLMGVTLGVLQNNEFWMGEGDDMTFVDDETKPLINGTGSEDYFLGSWNFGGRDGARPFFSPHVWRPVHTAPRAHRRPLPLLPVARRQSGHVHALPETHHGARPRQQPWRQFLLVRLLVSDAALHQPAAIATRSRAHSGASRDARPRRRAARRVRTAQGPSFPRTGAATDSTDFTKQFC